VIACVSSEERERSLSLVENAWLLEKGSLKEKKLS
jgi:hypothetical protein